MPASEALGAQNRERASQTLSRAIDLLDALRDGPLDLKGLQDRVGLTRSTSHRLAQLLIDRDFVALDGRRYRLGPKLILLGERAAERRDLLKVARPTVDELAAETEDAVNLAIRDQDEIIYIAQAPSRRRIAVRHSIGDRNLISATALGRALMLDAELVIWSRFFPDERRDAAEVGGCVLHIDDGDDLIRCIAAPIRGASGGIIAALSLSSIPQYLDEARLHALAPIVRLKADEISAELGYARQR
jgi:DNA-binding IclR family transcriptional regulator